MIRSIAVLTESQQTRLDAIVQGVNPNLEVEAARLDAQQSLEVVLCREIICFRPLHIAVQDVDIPAALDGEPQAHQALQSYLRTALQGLI
jgi:hypothetical protein